MSDRKTRLVVSADGPTGTVELDGVDISNEVRGIDIKLRAGELPQVGLDVVVIDLSSEVGGVDAHIPAETRDLLIRLGWTPPEDP